MTKADDVQVVVNSLRIIVTSGTGFADGASFPSLHRRAMASHNLGQLRVLVTAMSKQTPHAQRLHLILQGEARWAFEPYADASIELCCLDDI